jgi:iron complex transport system ATP-binding protein
MTALLEGRGLSFSYDDRPVFRDVNIALAPGELVALVGPNGAGKSTLLHVLLGLLPPASGAVSLEGRPISLLSRRSIAQKIAFLPQEVRSDFAFTVRELVGMGRLPHLGRFRPEGPADVAAIEDAMARTATTPYAERLVSELSGGERQRVVLARAIAQSTDVLLLDEPTASLDVEHQLDVIRLIRALVETGKAAAIALHDLSLAARFADRVVVLSEGRIAAEGPPAEVITEELLSRHFRIRARIEHAPEGVVVVPIAPIDPGAG